jgi:hypothetical protein
MKYYIPLLVILGAMFLAVSCGLFSFLDIPSEDEKPGSVTFYVKVENLPHAFKLERFYVTDDSGAQIGPGVQYSDTDKAALSVPAIFVGQELNVCAGYGIMTYVSEKVTIASGITVILTMDGINVGVPGGFLPEIPNTISSGEIKVTSEVTVDQIKSIYVTSYEGSRISTAIQEKDSKRWKLNLPDDFTGMTLRFWVNFESSGSPFFFYEDIEWDKGNATTITITYKGKPIANHSDLLTLASAGTGDHFVITNAISVGGAPWVPLDAFSGKLHGGGYKISGIKFAQPRGSYGLFSRLSGEVSDLRLEYADASPLVLSMTALTDDGNNSAMAGILAGEMAGNSKIENVMVMLAGGVSKFSVKVTLSGGIMVSLGGIVGYINGLYCTLSQSYSSARIELAPESAGDHKYFIGGLAGRLKGDISASYSRGDVWANGILTGNGVIYAGGLAGGLADTSLGGQEYCGVIDTSYASGDVLAMNNGHGITVVAGGLVGMADSEAYRIKDSAANNGLIDASGSEGNKFVCSILGSPVSIPDSGNKRRIGMTLSGGTVYLQGGELGGQGDWPMFPSSVWIWDSTNGYPRLFWQHSSIEMLEKWF